MAEDIQRLVKEISEDAKAIRVLRDDPGKLAEEYDLDPDEITALRASDLLLVRRFRNPLVANTTTTYTFTTGSTITAGQFPMHLDDLTKEQLVDITERVLIDDEYAKRVSRFLNL